MFVSGRSLENGESLTTEDAGLLCLLCAASMSPFSAISLSRDVSPFCSSA